MGLNDSKKELFEEYLNTGDKSILLNTLKRKIIISDILLSVLGPGYFFYAGEIIVFGSFSLMSAFSLLLTVLLIGTLIIPFMQLLASIGSYTVISTTYDINFNTVLAAGIIGGNLSYASTSHKLLKEVAGFNSKIVDISMVVGLFTAYGVASLVGLILYI